MENQNQRQNQNPNQTEKAGESAQSRGPAENQRPPDRAGELMQVRAMEQNLRQSLVDNYSLRETRPHLGGGRVTIGDRLTTTFDLVEQMHYLYVRIVKARDLPVKDGNGSVDPCAEVRVGNYVAATKRLQKNLTPEWNQVFAFYKETIQASAVVILLKDKENVIGHIDYELSEVPKRAPPDSPLAPEWYRLEDRNGMKVRGELMLSVWMGTQADEAFSDAWHSEAASISSEGAVSIRSKVYLSPKLWYLRVNVIEAQALVPIGNRQPNTFVKCVMGHLTSRTRMSQCKSINPVWNEDLMFVVAEPFDEQLILTVEDKVNPNKDETLGKCVISLQTVTKRFEPRPVDNKWYSLEKYVVGENGQIMSAGSTGRIHVRICLEGGYHVLDESTYYSSDLKPTAKQLWRPSIGVLELGILSAQGLLPMKNREGKCSTDAYCVAKYGSKWVRTRTIIDSFAPKWNEQYTWEVFDPCTVITIGVFDNVHLQGGQNAEDGRIGKVRIRLSTLESNRLYTHSYPLLVLQPNGLKKMGEIQLAVRFTALSLLNMMQMYSQPLLPRMHYVHPLSTYQMDTLRHQAIQIVSMRLSRAEPPLRREAVAYLLDLDSHMWSMRRSKANFHRIVAVLSSLTVTCKKFSNLCQWKNPKLTMVTHVIYLFLVICPGMILPAIFIYWFFIGLWNLRYRPRNPPHMDTKLSYAEKVHEDDLDEEFDPLPTKRSQDVVKIRYDRLRCIAGRLQILMGDLATQGERFQSLLSWRDPRASFLFVMFCLIAAVSLVLIPLKGVVLMTGFYLLRHPKLRSDVPSAPLNFFRRLPARTESII